MQQSRRDIAPSLIADNRNERRTTPAAVRSIAGFDACVTSIDVGDDRIRLATVADLERYVDRDALLRAEDPPEPPYWAHCWSGARVLAERVPREAGRVLEVGCGLGLPGLVAAARGARVVFADRMAAPLAFVRASLDANALHAGTVVADVLDAPWRSTFDLVLAAEIIYDRATFGALAATLKASLARGGGVLLADGHRIDTRGFYEAATAAGLVWSTEDVQVAEEGFPITITLVAMRAA
jgi:predicted nicotinamide N-methyase